MQATDALKTSRSARLLRDLPFVCAALAILHLWLLPLRSSFWVDEMVTAFVVHYGPAHPSLATAPQVPESVYYWLPKIAEKVFGFSEVIYRLPSTILMAVALLFIYRLASRLVHPGAGWFAVFACFSLRLFNYQADDARPYAMGTCVAAAALWFLVQWFDSGPTSLSSKPGSRRHSIYAALFVLFAALLWRVHLIYWPFYLVFAAYAAARLIRRDTRVTPFQAIFVFAVVGAALIPVALRALSILHQAQAHVIIDHMPSASDLKRALKFNLVLVCPAAAWLLTRIQRLPLTPRPAVTSPAIILILGWWLIQPLALFAFSWFSRNSIFVDRYLSLSLPGCALMAALTTSYFLPARYWRNASLVFGVGIVLFMGTWRRAPLHHNSDWRAASASIRALHLPASTPIVYPSVFIEARPPVWRPDYPLPGFLYSHILFYPVGGQPYLFPFEMSPQAESYAAELSRGVLPAAGRFVIYGGDVNVRRWQKWFSQQPEFAGWNSRSLGKFGDVESVLFERGA